MTTRRKIALGITLAVLAIAGWVVWRAVYVWQRLPEAYAAWDTGTLLLKYMEANESRWPSTWEDLFALTNAPLDVRHILHGAEKGQTDYLETLPEKVLIDWSFNPRKDMDHQRPPVTRLNGTVFPVVWQGGDPNDMVRRYLEYIESTNAPLVH